MTDAKRRQRGYVLITAIALAILYFGLMELMLIDSQRALRESQRFRARIIATTLAENGAELAAEQLITRFATEAEYQNEQGRMLGTMKRGPSDYSIDAIGSASGVPPVTQTVKLRGKVIIAPLQPPRITIDYAYHSQ